MTGDIDWRGAKAPGRDVIEQLARTAWDQMPHDIRTRCGALSIHVGEFAAQDILSELEVTNPYDLMGLYHGIQLQSGNPQDGKDPDKVYLFRRPILDYWVEKQSSLGTIVAQVLIREIGHHFGFSESQIEGLEAQAATS